MTDHNHRSTEQTEEQKQDQNESIKSPFTFTKKTEDPVPYRDWMDVAFKEYQESGGLDHLSGQGQPLKHLDQDVLNGVLKEAGYKPAWLELQHKIRDQLIQLIERSASLDEQTLQLEVEQLNKLVAKLNREVPSPLLQKTRIFPDVMHQQLKHWL